MGNKHIIIPIIAISLPFITAIIIVYIKSKKRADNFTKNNYKEKYENAIKTLVRQAARWSTASVQDENVMISVLHANYGAGYLWALLDIAEPNEINKITGINIQKFKSSIVNAQDSASKKMIKVCPNFAPKTSYLTKIAGEG